MTQPSKPISPLRQRMLERKLSPKTQTAMSQGLRSTQSFLSCCSTRDVLAGCFSSINPPVPD